MKCLLGVVLTAVLALSSQANGTVGISGSRTASSEACFRRGEIALIEGQRQIAKREFECVIRATPQYAPVYSLYPLTLDRTEREEVAAELLRTAEAKPADPLSWYAYGRTVMDMQKMTEAFDRVVRLDPGSPWGYVGLGFTARFFKRDDVEAVRHYEKALSLSPGEVSIVSALAVLYESIREPRHQDARRLFAHLQRAAPSSVFTEIAFGRVFQAATGDDKRRLALWYLRQFPKGSFAGEVHAYEIAQVQVRSPQEAARRAVLVLSSLDPVRFSTERTHIFKVFILAPATKDGRQECERLARRVLASEERSPVIYMMLADGLSGVSASSELIVQVLTKGIERAQSEEALAEHESELRLGLARLLLREGDASKAQELLRSVAPTVIISEGQIAESLGEVSLEKGDGRGAYESFVRAVALRPSRQARESMAKAAASLGLSLSQAEQDVWTLRDSRAIPAGDFELNSLAGEATRLSKYRGRVVLLYFWFPGCPPCRKELPELQTLYAQYRGQGFEIIAIDVTSSDTAAREFFRANNLEFPSLRGNQQLAESLFAVTAQPTSLLVDAAGRILFRHVGYRNTKAELDQLRYEIEELTKNLQR